MRALTGCTPSWGEHDVADVARTAANRRRPLAVRYGMLHTALCDSLAIDVPIIVAPFGPWAQVDLAVATAEAGCLASLGTAVRTVSELEDQWREMRSRTDRPFAINHTGRPFVEEVFAATLDAAPAAISFHMGVPADLIARAHERGILWLQTVGDAAAAELALEAGADVLIAQGGEAGGNSGQVATMVLVPEIVDLAGDVPVVAAGGIGDGRGVAAALALGAQGASLGTRFLATTEMAIDPAWKARICAAVDVDAVKVPHAERSCRPSRCPRSARRSRREACALHSSNAWRGIRPASIRPSSAPSSSPPSAPGAGTTCCRSRGNLQRWSTTSSPPRRSWRAS